MGIARPLKSLIQNLIRKFIKLIIVDWQQGMRNDVSKIFVSIFLFRNGWASRFFRPVKSNYWACMFSINPKFITWAITVILLSITTDVYGGFGRNEIGLKVGMINPRDYEPYFPIQSEEIEEYVQYGNAALYFFYLRNINSELNAGIDIGFAGILDKSDNNTILKAYPIDIYMAAEVLKLYGVEAYLGGGYTWWLMEDKDDDLQGISGLFFKLELVYLDARFEISYSHIDHFGANKYDLGGISARVGLSYQFSYL